MGIMNQVMEFWNYISKFPYGIYSSRTGKPAKDNESYRYMIYQSPEMMKKHGFGMCYDCCAMQTEFFKKIKVRWQNYFVEIDTGQTHTFSVFRCNNQNFYFESSFKAYAGVFKINSEEEVVNRVLKQMLTFDKLYKAEYAVYLYEEYTNYGCNIAEFQYAMEEKEKLIQDVFIRKE